MKESKKEESITDTAITGTGTEEESAHISESVFDTKATFIEREYLGDTTALEGSYEVTFFTIAIIVSYTTDIEGLRGVTLEG